jgi:hypothetical protein
MLRADARTEVMRRAGLYLGAAILGFWCSAWFDYFSGGPLQASLPMASTAYALAFAALGCWLGVTSHNWLLRTAWIMFAVQHVVNAFSPILRNWPVGWVSNLLTGVFAILLVIAGARRRTARVLLVALAVFVGAMIIKIGVSMYAKRVRSGYSVVKGGIVLQVGTSHEVIKM